MRGVIKGINDRTIMLHMYENVDYPIDTEVDVEKHKDRRSLNANGYYWQLLRQLSEKIHVNPARIHNENLRTMWLSILKEKDGEPIMLLIPDTDEAEQKALDDRDDHLMPIPIDYLPDGFTETITKASGKRFRWYTELRGSRTFNTAEMSRLIDLLVTLCHEQGIETMTPAELMRLDGYEKYGN